MHKDIEKHLQGMFQRKKSESLINRKRKGRTFWASLACVLSDGSGEPLKGLEEGIIIEHLYLGAIIPTTGG